MVGFQPSSRRRYRVRFFFIPVAAIVFGAVSYGVSKMSHRAWWLRLRDCSPGR
jgi:hypothetical protein